MVFQAKPLTIRLKRGDDFRLPLAVRDRKTEYAKAAYEEYLSALSDWRDAVNADPPDSLNITVLESIKNVKLYEYDTRSQVNITDWTITCAVSWGIKFMGTGTVSFEDATKGLFNIHLPNSFTELLKPRTYFLEIGFLMSNGDKVSSTDIHLIVDRNTPIPVV